MVWCPLWGRGRRFESSHGIMETKEETRFNVALLYPGDDPREDIATWAWKEVCGMEVQDIISLMSRGEGLRSWIEIRPVIVKLKKTDDRRGWERC